ncbi:PilX N-terminal domain-containing pilus assembly protein [Bacillus sp. JJ1521]|uniref:PilX N-terminal domain-containing pilus assembly protein n=1 Tax=Bacillus sp. JJ1521 TaxID=3122957 RepID=UPI002FFEDD72
MRNLKNEQGMTLVVVLLILTVISILGLAVMGASLTNMKQISKTESNIITTDIAEMGVVYYETQLKSFLNEQLYNQAKQKEIIIRYFTNSASTDVLIEKFNLEFPVELNNLYKTNNTLFTQFGDHFLPEKTVDANSSFKIKINPNGITTTTCSPQTPANSQCYRITYESYGYYGDNLEKILSATFDFSYFINRNSIVISTGTPPPVPLYEDIKDSVQGKNLRACTTADFKKNNTTVDCSSNLDPKEITSMNGISNSFIVFNKGVNLDHLSHAVSNSKLIIHSLDVNNPTRIGKFNPNGFINSSIVIIGNAKLYDQIMKPVNSSIYITGDADLTGFSLKNATSTKVCVQGKITPADMRSIPGVYSNDYNSTTYTNECMRKSDTVGNNSLTIKGEMISPRIDEKSNVTY